MFVSRTRDLEKRKRDGSNYNSGFWEENQLTIIFNVIALTFPPVCELVGHIEKYHPRTSLRMMLSRMFVLNLLNMYTLFIALYYKQEDLSKYLEEIKRDIITITNCTSTGGNTTLNNITVSSSDWITPSTDLVSIGNILPDLMSSFPSSGWVLSVPYGDYNETVFTPSLTEVQLSQESTAALELSSSILNLTKIWSQASMPLTAITASSSTTYRPGHEVDVSSDFVTPGGNNFNDFVSQDNNSEICVNITITPPEEKEFCWETMIGQEVFKLTILDTVFLLIQILLQDVIRTYLVRYCNCLCCWDPERTFPEYPEFKTAENLLTLISNQGVIWCGAFFSPGLPLVNLVKLVLVMYVRYWTVTVYSVPDKRIFRASRSNNFYYSLLLVTMFLCMLPPLFAVLIVPPSPQCGPFSGRYRMYDILTEALTRDLPTLVTTILQYIISPAVIVTVFILSVMIIYYLSSVNRSLKEANNELRLQLEYERTKGRKKVYAMAEAKYSKIGHDTPQEHKIAALNVEGEGSKDDEGHRQAKADSKAWMGSSKHHDLPEISLLDTQDLSDISVLDTQDLSEISVLDKQDQPVGRIQPVSPSAIVSDRNHWPSYDPDIDPSTSPWGRSSVRTKSFMSGIRKMRAAKSALERAWIVCRRRHRAAQDQHKDLSHQQDQASPVSFKVHWDHLHVPAVYQQDEVRGDHAPKRQKLTVLLRRALRHHRRIIEGGDKYGTAPHKPCGWITNPIFQDDQTPTHQSATSRLSIPHRDRHAKNTVTNKDGQAKNTVPDRDNLPVCARSRAGIPTPVSSPTPTVDTRTFQMKVPVTEDKDSLPEIKVEDYSSDSSISQLDNP